MEHREMERLFGLLYNIKQTATPGNAFPCCMCRVSSKKILMFAMLFPLAFTNNLVVYSDAARFLLNCACCNSLTQTSSYKIFKKSAGSEEGG
jgi:hypothetical protein